MGTMNHTNLTTYNVPALAEFFTLFGFSPVDRRGDKLAVLKNPDGFVLTLMFDKRMTPDHGYPGLFHVGFLQPAPRDVDSMHSTLSARSYDPPEPAILERGGPPTYGFYCNAPGGVMVEVSTMNLVDRI